MIDRNSRDALADAIRAYLNDEITAFKLDECVQEVEPSKDATVQVFARELWLSYDDCKDHRAMLDRTQWNLFQRMELFLRTDNEFDARYRHVTRRSFHAVQGAALIALVVQLAALCIHPELWKLLCLAGAFVALPVWILRRRLSHHLFTPEERRCSDGLCERYLPFVDFGDICRAVRTTGFRKQPWRPQLAARRARSRLMELLLWLLIPALLVVGLYVLSPLVLLIECLPPSDTLPERIDQPMSRPRAAHL